KGASLGLELRPRSNVTVSLNPSINRSKTGFQFVDSYADPTATSFFGTRYVFAHLTQNSVSMDTRFNVTFSPNLTLELFMQPLIATGAYSRYNVYAAPRTAQRLQYGRDFGTVVVQPAANSSRDPAPILLDADTLGGGGPRGPNGCSPIARTPSAQPGSSNTGTSPTAFWMRARSSRTRSSRSYSILPTNGWSFTPCGSGAATGSSTSSSPVACAGATRNRA